MSAAKPLPWFRMYNEAIDDEKLRLVAFEDRWHFVAILCCKAQGILDSGSPIVHRLVAVKLGIDQRTLDDVARRLAEVGLIDEQTLQPLAWDNRQMRSDSSSERVRAFREKVKREGNVSVTAQEVDTETEKETEGEKQTPSSGKPAAPAGFAAFWEAYPNTARRVAKSKCLALWKSRKLEAVADDIVSHVKAMATTRQWQDGYEPAPMTYLNQSRWQDEIPTGKTAGATKHGNFGSQNYRAGVGADGSF
ncbi:hypothetical protein IMZ29_00905 [Achromobacter sp. GG226]|uniref:hypothetical protein n=1 Tax=Verticiella alkaliphila TaxID=2779529 RepID=UPI001C0D03FF|nr:hypothetical protein [Verticiella sp. GG226]MBU4609162.1 hypothetical protein [Verticiella sp. GG226]